MSTPPLPGPDAVDGGRMTVGEHLDELRSRLMRSLLAIVIGCLVLVYPAKFLLAAVVRPAQLALQRHGQPQNLLQTSPTEVMLIYLKVVLIGGLVLASPYVLYQVWQFVAAGLFPRERAWVMKLFPFSVALFIAGVGFMYAIVLLVSLNFLVGFSGWISLPDPKPNPIEQMVLGGDGPSPPPPEAVILPEEVPNVPFVPADPVDPPDGAIWFNTTDGKLKLNTGQHIVAQAMNIERKRPLATTYFKIGEYLNFVLTMTLAFGVAFQMPLVVLGLNRTGVMSVDQLRKTRKYFYLGILVTAGVLAPPELISHMLLAIPMLLLFELGITLARRQKRPASE
jgi:sec-independent protein translocase protein TatC